MAAITAHPCAGVSWQLSGRAGVGVPWATVPKWHTAMAALAKAIGFLLYLFSKASVWIWGSACTVTAPVPRGLSFGITLWAPMEH